MEKKDHGYDRFAFFEDEKGQEMRLRFGSLVLTPNNKKRVIYEGNDLTDEHVKFNLLNKHYHKALISLVIILNLLNTLLIYNRDKLKLTLTLSNM